MPDRDKNTNTTRPPSVHININKEPINPKAGFLIKLWEESTIGSYILKCFKGISQKPISLLVIIFLFLFVFFYDKDGESVDKNGAGKKEIEITQEVDMLTKIIPTEGDGEATAILLNWNRLDNIKVIVKNLCQYSMFKEIFIWNNNVDIHLSDPMFVDTHCNKIRYYNSPGNMYFIARYLACSMATTKYCYFQDDDWMIKHLRSMYSNFLRFPNLIHSDTNADVYSSTNWKWCFFNDDIDLHSCFSWVGTGAFTSRENALKFLRMTSKTEMSSSEFMYGDMYFTTYLNQVPYQLENSLIELPQEIGFSLTNQDRMRNKLYMHRALIRLYDYLSSLKNNSSTKIIEDTKEFSPTLYERDVRSPCHNDKCLFLTNKHSFPNIKLFKYKPYINISESERLHSSFFNTQHFISYPYSHAVDNESSTAWISQDVIRKGDYIGLDLLLPMPVPLTFSLIIDHNNDYFDHLSIQISHDGSDWIQLSPLPKLEIHEISSSLFSTKNNLSSCKFRIRETGFRFLKLVSTVDWNFTFSVYDFTFNVIDNNDNDNNEVNEVNNNALRNNDNGND